jgi:hypothetical protein
MGPVILYHFPPEFLDVESGQISFHQEKCPLDLRVPCSQSQMVVVSDIEPVFRSENRGDRMFKQKIGSVPNVGCGDGFLGP